MRDVFVCASPDRRTFRVEGTGRWADFGDAWLMAHDLVHHAPTDTGRIEQELCTFGVELWLEEPRRLPENCIDWSQVAGAIAEGYRGSRRLTHFVVPPAPAASAQLPPGYRALFESWVEQGFADAASAIEQRYAAAHARPLFQRELDRFVGEDNQARAVDWIAYGYLSAPARYPDREQAKLVFDRLYRFFNMTRGCAPARFAMSLDVANGAVAIRHARLQQTWDEVVQAVQ